MNENAWCIAVRALPQVIFHRQVQLGKDKLPVCPTWRRTRLKVSGFDSTKRSLTLRIGLAHARLNET